jgi:outer membrane protein
MGKTTYAVALACGLLAIGGWVASATAQDLPIAYITSWKIIGPESQFQPSRDAQAALQRDVESWNRELDDLQTELLEKTEELQKQRLLMTESQLREKEQQLFQLRADLERRTKEIWDTGGLVERRNAELMQPIYDRLIEAIERVAQERGLAFVFEAGDGNLVWADRAHDITQDVLQALGEMMDVPLEGSQQ